MLVVTGTGAGRLVVEPICCWEDGPVGWTCAFSLASPISGLFVKGDGAPDSEVDFGG